MAGEKVIKYRRFCKCGCGRKVLLKSSIFLKQHHRRGVPSWNKGKEMSEEFRKKLSEVNKGKIYSKETKQKMSKARKGKKLNEEIRQKISNAKKGKTYINKETRKKISLSLMGHEVSKETREKLSIAGRGHKVDEETRRKISKGNEGKILSRETREKISISNMGKRLSDRVKEKVGLSNKGKKRSEEFKKRISMNWKDPEYIRKQMKARGIKPNKLEIQFEDILKGIFSNEYKYVGDGQFIIAGKCPDFININGKKKIIELYGEYWHRNEDPQDRVDLFKQYGYDTLIVWDYELKKERKRELERKLELFHDRRTGSL